MKTTEKSSYVQFKWLKILITHRIDVDTINAYVTQIQYFK